MPGTGDILLISSYGEPDEIHGAWPRNRLVSTISRDEGNTFSSMRLLTGSRDFAGKVTMPAVTFVGNEALIFYGKSPTKANTYDWVRQVVPIAWFYEGEKAKVFGARYLEEMRRSGSK
jgi:hypothetical protein